MSKEVVNVVAVQKIDFTADDGSLIKGTKVYYLRQCYDNELGRGWVSDKILRHDFIREGSEVSIPKFEQLPVVCNFNYLPQGRYNRLASIEIVPEK